MVDGRSVNMPSITSSFNFKSGDISGTAAKTSDEKMGQGTEYFATYPEEGEYRFEDRYVDRSAQLGATLNSLAMMNVANIIKKGKVPKHLEESIEEDLTLIEEIEDDFLPDENEKDDEEENQEENNEEKYAQSPED